MSTESRQKDRAMIAELAKLAYTLPAEPAPAEREESSGVVHLPSIMTVAPPPPLAATRSVGDGAGSPRAAWRWLAILAVGVVAVAVTALAPWRPGRVAGAQPIVVTPAGAPRLAEDPRVAEDSYDGRVLPPSSPPAAAGASAPPGPQPQMTLQATPVKTAATARASAAPPPPTAPPSPAAAVSPVAPAAGSAKSLGELMQEAVGATRETTPVVATAAATAEPPADAMSMPARPSLGAIKSAVGAVLPAAQGCLDGDAPISYANITFRSDGSVAAVAISGWAAGKPVEACIRRALSGARVPPFRQATYAVPATVRGN
jgi:hypothetical protein